MRRKRSCELLPLIIVARPARACSSRRRNRQPAAAAEARAPASIGVGTEVMTTSGLYGTVVGVNDDEHRPAGDRPRRRGEMGLRGAARRRLAARPIPGTAARPTPNSGRSSSAPRPSTMRPGRIRSTPEQPDAWRAQRPSESIRPRRSYCPARLAARAVTIDAPARPHLRTPRRLPRGTTRRNAARRALLPRAARRCSSCCTPSCSARPPHTPKLGLDLRRRHPGHLQAKTHERQSRRPSRSMNQARQIIEQRVNGTGVTESTVVIQGSDQIVVSVPGKTRPTSRSSARPPC